MKSEQVLTKQEQIARNAERLPEVSFTSLAYHMDIEWMKEAFVLTRKDGASGVDGVTGKEYMENLINNLSQLLDKAKIGTYHAPAIRRVYIPKGSGKEMRPLGIPTFEDKVLQRAVVMLLNPLYEQDFYDFSYGFREGKSAHGALQQLWKNAMDTNGWIIDIDIRKYFDSIDHGKLREVLKQRVSDGVILKLIGKWLNAGILEEGQLSYPKDGTPQGGVISPLLSNIFLHEVLDKWFMNEVKPRMKGKAFMIRFADDAILGFSDREDALKVMEVLPKRFEKFNWKLHEEKTKLVKFTKPKGNDDENDTFNFLGFTHYWGKSRKGNYVIRKKTQKERLARALKSINKWCSKNRHDPIGKQAFDLSRKLKGHYGYYGVTGNSRGLGKYYHRVIWIWFKWLRRRTDKNGISYEKFVNILKRYSIPRPRIVHTYA